MTTTRPVTSPARRRALALLASTGALHAVGARAQGAWPARPVRIVVPFAPGSGSDSYARYVAEPLSRALGQPVVVENKAGADGVIGTQEVVRADPDGYTLLLGSNSTLVLNPLLRSDLPYRPQDFRALSGLVRAPAMIVTSVDSPLRSVADLLAEARRTPGGLSFASYAPALRMAVAWLESLASIRVNHVSYKGAAQLMTDLGGGQVGVAMVDATAAMNLVNGRKIRAIAVAAAERHPGMPEVPTMREAGFPEFFHYSWIGVYAPSATPEPAVRRLESALAGITASPEFAPFVEKGGGSPMPFDGARMSEWLAAETERYRRLVKAAGL